MKRGVWLLWGLVVLVLALGVGLAEEKVTLNGEFVWARDDGDRTGELKAVFTSTGKSQWDVAFHFDWEDGPHVYAGTAKGSLSDGTLEGEVENDDEERKSTFKFKGSVENGKFAGTHAVISKEGERRDTGTFTLAPAG